MQTQLESYSAGYLFAPEVEVNRYGEDLAIMDEELYEDLARQLGEPVIGYVGGLHYEFMPSTGILSGRCAVPRSNHREASTPLALLVQR